MYKKYYQLNSEPFRLTPDPRFVFAHRSYQKAHEYMRHTLEQGDGILVITGRAGTGKTTLVEDLLAGLSHGKVHTATLVSTQLEVDDLLRMVAYAFGVNAKGLDKATLLRELEKFLENQSHALLVIDEAQNLSSAALEEIRMLTNLHVRSHPLLQIFLLGQEELLQRLRKPEMEQLHQRLMAVCNLEPLSLQETRGYVVHRLNCAGWRGDPAISAGALVLLHRFSQGLPRYINKLCDRLFLHGAVEQRHLLEVDDLVTVISEIQDEMLLPLMPEKEAEGHGSIPDVQALVGSDPLPADWVEYLTTEEQAFIERCPDVTEPVPMAPPTPEMLGEKPSALVSELAADSSHPKQAVLDRLESELKAVATREYVYKRPARSRRRWKRMRKRKILGYGLAVPIVLMSVYGLLYYNDVQQKLPIVRSTIATGAERVSVSADPPGTEPKAPPAEALEASHLAKSRQQKTSDGDGFSEPENKAKAPKLADGDESSPAKEEAIASVDDKNTLATSGGGTESQEPPVVNSTPLDSPARPNGESADMVVQPAKAAAKMDMKALLLLGKQAVEDDRLRFPEQRSGWHYYKQVLKLDPGNQDAQRGLEQIAERYGELASNRMEKQQYDKAQLYITRGLGVVSGHSKLLALQREIQIQRDASLAMQEREQMLALQAREAKAVTETVSEAESQPSRAESRPIGFLGTLKNLFTDRKAESPEQVFQANDR